MKRVTKAARHAQSYGTSQNWTLGLIQPDLRSLMTITPTSAAATALTMFLLKVSSRVGRQ
jgi:hypothetical protein